MAANLILGNYIGVNGQVRKIKAVYQKFGDMLIEFVPVVRCKDCKHANKKSPHGIICNCPIGGQNTSLLSGDDFCSCGERKR